MNTFEATTHSEATVAASRERVWSALTDPVLLARLTPYVRSIDVDGHRWRWNLSRIPILGTAIAPSFTVVMTFEEPHRIEFAPAPEVSGEQAAVNGTYRLARVTGGTHLLVALTVRVDLPLPRAARRPAKVTMNLVMAFMGKRFSANLLRHLGIA